MSTDFNIFDSAFGLRSYDKNGGGINDSEKGNVFEVKAPKRGSKDTYDTFFEKIKDKSGDDLFSAVRKEANSKLKGGQDRPDTGKEAIINKTIGHLLQTGQIGKAKELAAKFRDDPEFDGIDIPDLKGETGEKLDLVDDLRDEAGEMLREKVDAALLKEGEDKFAGDAPPFILDSTNPKHQDWLKQRRAEELAKFLHGKDGEFAGVRESDHAGLVEGFYKVENKARAQGATDGVDHAPQIEAAREAAIKKAKEERAEEIKKGNAKDDDELIAPNEYTEEELKEIGQKAAREKARELVGAYAAGDRVQYISALLREATGSTGTNIDLGEGREALTIDHGKFVDAFGEVASFNGEMGVQGLIGMTVKGEGGSLNVVIAGDGEHSLSSEQVGHDGKGTEFDPGEFFIEASKYDLSTEEGRAASTAAIAKFKKLHPSIRVFLAGAKVEGTRKTLTKATEDKEKHTADITRLETEIKEDQARIPNLEAQLKKKNAELAGKRTLSLAAKEKRDRLYPASIAEEIGKRMDTENPASLPRIPFEITLSKDPLTGFEHDDPPLTVREPTAHQLVQYLKEQGNAITASDVKRIELAINTLPEELDQRAYTSLMFATMDSYTLAENSFGYAESIIAPNYFSSAVSRSEYAFPRSHAYEEGINTKGMKPEAFHALGLGDAEFRAAQADFAAKSAPTIALEAEVGDLQGQIDKIEEGIATKTSRVGKLRDAIAVLTRDTIPDLKEKLRAESTALASGDAMRAVLGEEALDTDIESRKLNAKKQLLYDQFIDRNKATRAKLAENGQPGPIGSSNPAAIDALAVQIGNAFMADYKGNGNNPEIAVSTLETMLDDLVDPDDRDNVIRAMFGTDEVGPWYTLGIADTPHDLMDGGSTEEIKLFTAVRNSLSEKYAIGLGKYREEGLGDANDTSDYHGNFHIIQMARPVPAEQIDNIFSNQTFMIKAINQGRAAKGLPPIKSLTEVYPERAEAEEDPGVSFDFNTFSEGMIGLAGILSETMPGYYSDVAESEAAVRIEEIRGQRSLGLRGGLAMRSTALGGPSNRRRRDKRTTIDLAESSSPGTTNPPTKTNVNLNGGTTTNTGGSSSGGGRRNLSVGLG